VFLTVDEVYPDGVIDVVYKTTFIYLDWLADGMLKWHDGSAFSIADMVFGLIIGFPFDRAKPESAIYDSTMVSVYESGMSSFRGIKIVSEQPVVLEYYSTGISLYAELIANGDSLVMWPASGEAGLQPAWHNAALGIQVESQGLAAFGQGKATELGVDWISYVDGPTLQMCLTELTTARMTNYIPYEPTLGQWVTEADAIERYQNLEEFAAKYNHVYIGTGPMMLTQVDSLASITVLENNPDYPFETGHYLGVIPDSPEVPNVSATGPSTVTIGEAAVFDVSIMFNGEAYAADNIDKVVYLLIDANGEVAYDGEGTVLGDGAAQVFLTAA
jgi:peptide/nickel transport system substrate-binding protein